VSVYEIILLQNPAVSMCFCGIFPPLSNSVTRQAVVLESCSNAQKMWQVFEITMKKFHEFWILLF